MPIKAARDALNEAMHHEFARDPNVFAIGEDIAGGRGGSSNDIGCVGGIFGVTKGLVAEFGEERVIDTPISEAAIVGAASGAALVGMRPVAEIMFADFFGVCLDQVMNQVAKFRYMFGGESKCPMVIRCNTGAGYSAAAQHSQTMYQMMTAIPGLKVVIPSNAYDAKGLLISAIQDDDPVLFFEHKLLYQSECEVPDEALSLIHI